MKIQQTSFVLIAVVLLIILTGIFFLSFKLSSIKGVANEIQERESLLLVSKLANSPEFSCEESFGNKANCIDIDKVMALKEQINIYSNFWGVDNIEIRVIYPEMPKTPCTTLNYPECNILELINKDPSGVDSSNYVTLCRKEKNDEQIRDKCEIGLLSLRYKLK